MARKIRENADGTAAPVRLYAGPITFGEDGPTRPAQIVLVWEPEPRVEFVVEAERAFDDLFLKGDWERDSVRLLLHGGRECLSRPDRWDFEEDMVRVRGAVEAHAFGAPTVRRMRAHIINMPLVNRPLVTEMTGGGWRLSLKDRGSGDWEEKGFFVTGSLMVEREDGADFTVQNGVAVLDAFDHLATLAQGSWATHALPVGTGARGAIVWEQWVVGRVDRHETGDGWATQYLESVDLLPRLWPGFLSKWESPDWQPTLRTLATLLAEATAHTNGEAALLMIDVVLELLSWAVVVSDGAMVSAEGHDRLFGPDRLRLLLSVAEIDRRVPSRLPELAAAAKKYGWVDGPHAISEIRNGVVHPRKRRNLLGIAPGAIEEAQLMARDYAHGAIAYLLGARGWTPWVERWMTEPEGDDSHPR